MRGFSLIDLCVILLMLFFLVRGYQQGLIRQTLALVGLLIGLKVASDHFLYVSTFLETNLHMHEAMANIIGFTMILFIVIMVVNLVGMILSGLTKVLFLSVFDRTIGAIIGFIKGGVVVYVLLLLIAQIPYHPIALQLDKSVFARDLLSLTPYIQENLTRMISEK